MRDVITPPAVRVEPGATTLRDVAGERVDELERLFLIVHDGCDSRCALCDFWKRDGASISPQVVRDVVVPLVLQRKVRHICVTGGEPTLHDALDEVLGLLAATPATVTLITSTSGLGRWIESVAPSVDAYMISLDAADRGTYRRIRGIDLFDDVCAWPARINAVAPRAEVVFSCVLQRDNIGQLDAIYDVARAAGVDRLFLRAPDLKVESFGRAGTLPVRSERSAAFTPDDVERLAGALGRLLDRDAGVGLLGQSGRELGEKLRGCAGEPALGQCDVPFTSLVVNPSGSVSPCFYIPRHGPAGPDPANAPVLTQTRRLLLRDERFGHEHCDRCFQFDGHRT